MAFKVLSNEDWETEGFIGDFSVEVSDWCYGIFGGSVNNWSSMNNWGKVDEVLLGNTYSWEEGSLLCWGYEGLYIFWYRIGWDCACRAFCDLLSRLRKESNLSMS